MATKQAVKQTVQPKQPEPKVIAPALATVPKGPKILKVPRGTERERRRAGLVRGWRTIKGAKQMLPTKEQELFEASAPFAKNPLLT